MSKHLGLQRLGDKVSDNAPRHSGADVQQPARSIILPRSAVVKLPSLIQCECKHLKKKYEYAQLSHDLHRTKGM